MVLRLPRSKKLTHSEEKEASGTLGEATPLFVACWSSCVPTHRNLQSPQTGQEEWLGPLLPELPNSVHV
jgi:hypothetical protein